MAVSVMTAAKDMPIFERRGAGREATWAGALAEPRIPPQRGGVGPSLIGSRGGKDTSSSSIRGPNDDRDGAEVGAGGGAEVDFRLACGVGRIWELGEGPDLPSTMFAIRATSRSKGAILETMRSNNCLTSVAGFGVGVGGVVTDAERGKGPESGSLRVETAPGAGGSSSMALPGA
jgi:hypothetical protein